MVSFLLSVAVALGAYLIGSISPAWFAGRARGIDLRLEGRETLDFVNAWQVLGRGAGTLVFIADLLKGQMAVGLVILTGGSNLALVLAGAAVVAGELKPAFHEFSGGRGTAPAAGVLLAAAPWTLLISSTLFVLLAAVTGRLAHAELLAIVLMPGAAILAQRGSLPLMALTVALAGLLLWARWGMVETMLGARKEEED